MNSILTEYVSEMDKLTWNWTIKFHWHRLLHNDKIFCVLQISQEFLPISNVIKYVYGLLISEPILQHEQSSSELDNFDSWLRAQIDTWVY